MKVTKHARKRFKQRLGSISTGSYQNKVSDMLIQYNQNGCLYLKDYTEDLHFMRYCHTCEDYHTHKDYNVINIYKNTAIYKAINESTDNDWKLIWERKEIKPIKIAEALKAYNKGYFIISLLTRGKFHMVGRYGTIFITDATQEEIDDDWGYSENYYDIKLL